MPKGLTPDDAGAPITETGNGLTKDTFREHLKKLIAANGDRDTVMAARKTMRKEAKAAGIDLEKIDMVIRMLEWEPQEIREFIETLLAYMDFAELLRGRKSEDLTLFPEMEPEARAKADWELRGFLAATTGKGTFGTPPEECPPELHQDYLQGVHRGTQANAAPLGKKMNKGVPVSPNSAVTADHPNLQ